MCHLDNRLGLDLVHRFGNRVGVMIASLICLATEGFSKVRTGCNTENALDDDRLVAALE
jgi:hypothetical protein